MDKFVKPVSEAFVRCPTTMAVIPKEGMTVPWTGPIGRYWRRRVKHGEVKIVEVPKKEEVKPASSGTGNSPKPIKTGNKEATTDGN